MAVKISSLSSGNLQGVGGNAQTDRTDEAAGAKSLHGTVAGADDTISLTHTASEMQQLENRISQMSVVDAQLVEEVQRKLATGSFRIDPQNSANKMLMMELSLP
ncbi:MAG: flagellar biosynthesis anti-sigma factor FlgM [Gammaproteobacteria bacterium]|nr:flagellar biosynthesis anti-sigma factor FlgM [Gammaproteobacteria bacterium]